MRKQLLRILSGILGPYFRISVSDLQSVDGIKKIYYCFKKLHGLFGFVPVKAFLIPIVNKINSYVIKKELDKDSLRKALLTAFVASSDDNEKFFLTKMFYLLGLIDNTVSEAILAFSQETGDKRIRYWITMDISKMTFHLQSGFYERYYEDRRLLMKQIALENCYPIKKKNVSSVKDNVLILVYVMDRNILNSMQRVSVMVANALAERCSKVTVLSIDSFSLGKKERSTLTTLFNTPASYKIEKEVKSLYSDAVNVAFINGSSYSQRMQNALDYIYNYNPGCIIDITDEFSPLSYFYFKDFFTCYIPMRNNISSSFYTYMLGYEWMHLEERKKYFLSTDFPNKNWMFPEYVPPSGHKMSKEEIGVSADSFVIISIGNVKNGFTDSLIDKIAQMLEKESNLVWLMVGNGLPLSILKDHQALVESRKIIDWGFEQNLYGLCSACDIQLRPDITGGSSATAICSMHGKPLVMRKLTCDCLRWLGDDFTSIVSDEDLISEILHLYESETYYEECSKKIGKLVTRASDSEYWWNELYSIIKQGGE